MGESVLALATDAWGGYGGIATSTRDMLTAIAQHPSIDQVTVLPRSAPEPVDPPAGVAQLEPSFGRLSYSRRALGRALAARPRFIYCGHLFMAPLAALAARIARRPWALHLHGLEIWSPPSSLVRRALRRCDAVFAVSADTRRRAAAFGAGEHGSISVVNNCVGDAFRPGDRTAAAARFGLSGGPILSTVSRLDASQRHKGHERVLAALPGLVGRHPGLTYLIAGEGDDQPRLQAIAAEMGVADRVRFLGRAPAEALPDLYRATDLYVMPSTGEGFGIAFVEAMACGAPALGLAVGGAPDALLPGELGRAATPEMFEQALADALAAPPADRAALAAATRRRFGRGPYTEAVHAAIAPLLNGRADA